MNPVVPQTLLNEHPELSKWSILLAYRGSIAHGMYVPSTDPNSIDDIDLMSICVPPLETYFGLSEFGSRGTVETKRDEWDIVAYDIRKMFRMLSQCNPNVLSMLWLNSNDYIHLSEEGWMLLENRDLFSSKRAYHSFGGYARDQLKKMTNCTFKGYMGQKRKELVNRFGYDTKNAAHLIRLLRMAIEFLPTGRLIVKRNDDAEELLSIKRGDWSLEEVKRESDRLLAELKQAYALSSLTDEPDFDKINPLCVEIVSRCISKRRRHDALSV